MLGSRFTAAGDCRREAAVLVLVKASALAVVSFFWVLLSGCFQSHEDRCRYHSRFRVHLDHHSGYAWRQDIMHMHRYY